MGKALHPSVQEFKKFVKKHPKLAKEVRSGSKTWQELFEEWSIIGEKDDYWKPYRSDVKEEEVVTSEVVSSTKEVKKGTGTLMDDIKGSAGWIGNVFSYLKGVDMTELQSQIGNVGNTIQSIQQVVNQFRSPATTDSGSSTPPKQKPPTFHQKD